MDALGWILFILAAVAAVAALLNFFYAPESRALWMITVATTEYGHLLALLPLGVGVLAAVAEAGPGRLATLGLCSFALTGFWRPAFSAWRLGRTLPARQTAAFQFAGGTPAPFSVARLYFHRTPPRGPVRTEVYARHDGQDMALDFYPAAGSAAAACLVVIHGGGWDSGDRAQLADWNHRWAARGYAVAAVSYRLAPRWTWPAPREDLLAALAWLQAQAGPLGISPDRIVLVGRSAGGQIATAVGYGPAAPAVRGIVSFYAPYDMPFAFSIARTDDTLNSALLIRQYLAGPPDTPASLARYESASGHLMVRPGLPPTLLLQGTPDTLVWHRHSRRLAAELARAGVPHLLLELPWATHGFDHNLDGPGGQLADHAIERFLRGVTAD